MAAPWNRRAYGHKRILQKLGESPSFRRPPVEGYKLSCACGWEGGIFPRVEPAVYVYREHVDRIVDVLPHKCKACQQEKPVSEMSPTYRTLCRQCWSKKGNEWQKKNPEAADRHKKNHSLLKLYGITLGEFERKVEEQDGRCAVCKEVFVDIRGFRPHVDHDHATGQVRDILCFNCNTGLGAFKDKPDLLRAAIDYLERWGRDQ